MELELLQVASGNLPGTDRRLLRRFSGKCLSVYLGLARQFWTRLPRSLRGYWLSLAWARHLDRLVRRYSDRQQYFATFFLRNRPELELLRRIVDRKAAQLRSKCVCSGVQQGR